METIELDCAPGAPRPKDLIADVVKDTGLQLPEVHPTPFFGAVTYEFDVPREEWELLIQPVIKPRIVALYHAGLIRHGSW